MEVGRAYIVIGSQWSLDDIQKGEREQLMQQLVWISHFLSKCHV